MKNRGPVSVGGMFVVYIMFMIMSLFNSSGVRAAEDTYVDVTFVSQSGEVLGMFTNNPSDPAGDSVIEYCEDDLPLSVMIHGQTASGAGAENASVALDIDGATAASGVLDFEGVLTTSLDYPDLSVTEGDSQLLTATLASDATYNGTSVSGQMDVVACDCEVVRYKRGFLFVPYVDAGGLGCYENVVVRIGRVYSASPLTCSGQCSEATYASGVLNLSFVDAVPFGCYENVAVGINHVYRLTPVTCR